MTGITKVALLAAGGFVAYKLVQTSNVVQATARKVNPTLDTINGISQDFSSVSNAAVNFAKGLGSLFAVSGSGANSSLGRAPSSSTSGPLYPYTPNASGQPLADDFFGGASSPPNLFGGSNPTPLFGSGSDSTDGFF